MAQIQDQLLYCCSKCGKEITARTPQEAKKDHLYSRNLDTCSGEFNMLLDTGIGS